MADTEATTKSPARKPRAPKVQAADAVTPLPDNAGGEAKAKFAKALDEAKAGAQALSKQAQDTAGAYREKITGKSDALLEEAKAMTGQAKDKASALAVEGKSRAVEGISTAARLMSENASVLDEKLGAKYGDYARTAAKAMEDAAAKLDAKDLGELGEDAREMVRKSPGLAIGVAAAAGFFLARMFKGSDKPADKAD